MLFIFVISPSLLDELLLTRSTISMSTMTRSRLSSSRILSEVNFITDRWIDTQHLRWYFTSFTTVSVHLAMLINRINKDLSFNSFATFSIFSPIGFISTLWNLPSSFWQIMHWFLFYSFVLDPNAFSATWLILFSANRLHLLWHHTLRGVLLCFSANLFRFVQLVTIL